MSRDGSGNYSLPAGNPVSTGTTISSTWANNTFSDVASALTQSISKDGQTTYTGNQPMGGNRFTNVGNATARNEFATLGQVQDSGATYLTSVAGTNTITASLTGLTSYVTGQTFRFVPANTVTGATTLNINSIGAIAVTKQGTTALVSGDIVAGQAVQVVYDGTQFQLTQLTPNPTFSSFTVSGTATFASGSWTSTGASWTLATSGNPTVSYTNTTSDATSAKVRFLKSRTSATTNSGDVLGLVQYFGKDTSNVDRLGGYFQIQQTGTAGATFVAGQYVLNLTDSSGVDTTVISATAAAVDVPVSLQENTTRVFSRNSANLGSPPAGQNYDAANKVFTFAHGLGQVPIAYTAWARCIDASGNTTGNAYPLNHVIFLTNNNSSSASNVTADATNVYIRVAGNIAVSDIVTPSSIVSLVAGTKWELNVRAWY